MPRQRYVMGGRTHLRSFTAAEDERIMAQSRGELVLAQLKRELRTSDAAIWRRAQQLGVLLRVGRYVRNHPRARMQRAAERCTYDDDSTYWADRHSDPPRIQRDLLLERLQRYHPEHQMK
jgi:hypothetical protein